jgi:hypothetical protein
MAQRARSSAGLGDIPNAAPALRLGPARPARSNPIHAAGQQDVTRTDDRAPLASPPGPVCRSFPQELRGDFSGGWETKPLSRSNRPKMTITGDGCRGSEQRRGAESPNDASIA